MIPNHYGYGLRNDEIPYADKIPEGGNWRDLPDDEQRRFMAGAFGSGGGKTGYLRREAWDEPASTITASPMGKATCQLHPGTSERTDNMFYDVTPQLPPNGYSIVELFAGGGLLAIGLRSAGFFLKWANDFEKTAVEAYRHNLSKHILLGDITSEMIQARIPFADIIAGGPPCQDFSVAGEGAGEEGEKGRLVWTYLDIIQKKRPKAFVFENVKGLIQKKHRHTFDALLQKFDEIGYTVSWELINAWDYGVAQKRERVFIVGIRKDLGFTFTFPAPNPALQRTLVLRDVIGDLPDPGLELSDQAIEYLHSKDDRSLKKHRPPSMDEPGQTIVANIYKGVPYGLFYPDNHEGKEITEKAIAGYERRADKARGAFGLRVNDWDEPSPTIQGRIFNEGKAFVHPGPLNHKQKPRPRRFTVRECLRIQSVPDWYVLPASISLSSQYRIVGNGVASRVAYTIGQALAEQLNGVMHDGIHESHLAG